MFRLPSLLCAAAVTLAVPATSFAQDHGSASFVTGVSIARGSQITDTVSSVASLTGGGISNMNFAGRVAFNLAPGFQAVGEIGRIGNVLPPLASALLSFSPVELRARSIYEEGGVRFYAPHSSIAPYVEATGGMSHLSLSIDGTNTTADDLLRLGLGLTSRTSPMAGLGAGVMFGAGAVTFDAGYRYKKIFARDFVTSLLGGGGDLTSHQVAFAVGVRF